MGNNISKTTLNEYKEKIDDLEKRILELEQKVFLNYDNIDGKLVKSKEHRHGRCAGRRGATSHRANRGWLRSERQCESLGRANREHHPERG